MNEKEKKEFYSAMCGCCLLAQTMKTCAACRFNISLTQQPKSPEVSPLPMPVALAELIPLQTQLFVLAEQN